MKESPIVKYLPGRTEYVQVEDRVVATQPAYSIHLKPGLYHARHFFCQRCGTIFARRISPGANALHTVKKSYCREHSPTPPDLLAPYEWTHLEILGKEFLAYLFLIYSEEYLNDPRTQSDSSRRLRHG